MIVELEIGHLDLKDIRDSTIENVILSSLKYVYVWPFFFKCIRFKGVILC